MSLYNFSFISSLDAVNHNDWNNLLPDKNPFLRHEFLVALERNNCIGEKFGWYPHHLIVHDESKRIIAASPIYIKTNSYGEFVFDWSWASAYENSALNYYPKLVTAVPYTPVTGARLLIVSKFSTEQKNCLAAAMTSAIVKEAKRLEMSGMHWLFFPEHECELYLQSNLIMRLGCQYHWHNQNYECFDHFLERLISRKRKKIRRERQIIHEQNIHIRRLHGSEMDTSLWQQVHSFYVDTFYRKRSLPTLSLEFFLELGTTLGSSILLILAYSGNQLIACAINFKSDSTLYGRYWGSVKKYNSLHYEVCYYQGIEYAIEHRLGTFEPGAQGEYKISRGFLPTKTWSAHWIADLRFRNAIQDYCRHETQLMQQEYKQLMSLSPYRHSRETKL